MSTTVHNRIESGLKLCNFPDSTILYTYVTCNRIPFVSVYFCLVIVRGAGSRSSVV